MFQLSPDKKNFIYTVEGHWPFPVDMLRHDDSEAFSEGSQFLIDLYSDDHLNCSNREKVYITLIIKDCGNFRPNTARWESFGWKVPDDTDYYMWKNYKENEKIRKALKKSALSKLTEDEIYALKTLGLDE